MAFNSTLIFSSTKKSTLRLPIFFTVIVNRDFQFSLKSQALFCHFDSQGTLIDDFLKSVTQCIMNLHTPANYFFRKAGIFVFFFYHLSV